MNDRTHCDCCVFCLWVSRISGIVDWLFLIVIIIHHNFYCESWCPPLCQQSIGQYDCIVFMSIVFARLPTQAPNIVQLCSWDLHGDCCLLENRPHIYFPSDQLAISREQLRYAGICVTTRMRNTIERFYGLLCCAMLFFAGIVRERNQALSLLACNISSQNENKCTQLELLVQWLNVPFLNRVLVTSNFR